MSRWLALALLVACERADSLPADPPAPPGPRPIEPPPPPPTERTLDRTPEKLFVRITEDELFVRGIRVLVLTPATTPTEISDAVTRALPRSASPDDELLIDAQKGVVYAQVIAVMEGAKRAGYPRIAIGTGL